MSIQRCLTGSAMSLCAIKSFGDSSRSSVVVSALICMSSWLILRSIGRCHDQEFTHSRHGRKKEDRKNLYSVPLLRRAPHIVMLLCCVVVVRVRLSWILLPEKLDRSLYYVFSFLPRSHQRRTGDTDGKKPGGKTILASIFPPD